MLARHRDELYSRTHTLSSHSSIKSTLRYENILQQYSIVSSIEFDRDGECFATAGVNKKIKVFNFADVLSTPPPSQTYSHFPTEELHSTAKIR